MKGRTTLVYILCALFMLGYSVSLQAEGMYDITAGTEAQKNGDYDKAINFYTKAIESEELKENLIIAYVKRGHCYAAKDLLDLAIEDFTKAISLEPTNALHFTSRGIVYSKLKYWDRAIEDFSEAIKLNPDNVYAYKNRGIAYEQKGLKNLANQDFLKATQLGKEL
jgi:tetratricopeptide (TPR) repeat protein